MVPETTPEERPSPVVMAGEVPLIFDWKPVRWRRTRLAFWLGVAAVGHVLVFYLFQVVTASSPRPAPPVREALILPGFQEPSRGVLQGMEDRLPALGSPSPLTEPDTVALARLVKGYVPSWLDHRPQLKPLRGPAGSGSGGSDPPSLLGKPALLLPPLGDEAGRPVQAGDGMRRPSAVLRAGPVTRPLPVLSFQSGLAGRALVRGPEWPSAVTADEWPEEGPGSFLMSVSPEGNVTSCLSLVASAGLDEEVLRGVLMRLKFIPAPGSASAQWGWVDVLW